MSDIAIILLVQCAIVLIAVVVKYFTTSRQESEEKRRPVAVKQNEAETWTTKIQFSEHPNIPQEPDVPLKPCPFCGSSPKIIDNGVRHMIVCFGCGAQISNQDRGYHGGEPEELWNRRAGEDEL
ncbi:MAG: Lar family restriction alleviation protein [Thermoguttaceae bacterium]|nr:Lar family restriction alleviation protein [Thermoguttaceae bacterium]